MSFDDTPVDNMKQAQWHKPHGWVLILLLLFSTFGSFFWVKQSAMLVGHDASGYLDTSLDILDILYPLSPQHLFQAITYHHYRPTALFLAVQPLYALFGVSMDSALYLNVLLLPLVILLTYLLGKRVGGQGVGLYAAALVALLPMMMAMSRVFYTEIFLTAMVALNLLALYRSNNFTSRGWSIAWGVSFGVGLLIKWTMPIYTALPLLWQLWRGGVLTAQFQSLRQLRLSGRSLLLALAGGGALSAAWFLPNRLLAQQFPLGDWLFVGWWLPVAGVLYCFLLRGTALVNSWLALLLGALIASLWYLPHISFGTSLLSEDVARGQEISGPLQIGTHLAYVKYLYGHHFGALAFWVIVPLAALPWLRSVIQRRTFNLNSTLLWLSILSAYLVLMSIGQRNARNLVPLLPSLTVLIALALWAYPRSLRRILGAVWLGVLLLQWSLFTFDGLADFYHQTRSLWAVEDYARQPRSNLNDSAYWIAPDVIDEIVNADPHNQRLAMLVHLPQIHRGVFKYLIDLNHLDLNNAGLAIKSLTEEHSRGWYDLLSAQWLLVKDGENGNIEASGQALIARIFSDDKLFQTLYKVHKSYALPNGETIYLYHRTLGPGLPHTMSAQLAETKVVADMIVQAWNPHAQLIYADPELAVWVGIHDPVQERILLIEHDLLNLDSPNLDEMLDPLTGTLLVVIDAQSDDVQKWFETHSYRTFEVGTDFASVAIYGRPTAELMALPLENGRWADLEVDTLQTLSPLAPGMVLPIELTYVGTPTDDTKFSYRLVDSAGKIVATHDRPFMAVDRFGLFVPPQTPVGTYDLIALRYNPVDLQPIPTVDDKEAALIVRVEIKP